MRLLIALDLSTTVGFALLRRTMPPTPPRFGTLVLGGPLHDKLGQFYDWLPEAHRLFRFEAMAWEGPILKPYDKVEKLKLLYGLVGIAHGFARSRQMRWYEATVQQVKLAVSGNHLCDKDGMVLAAQQAGWDVANDHEADAGGVGVVSYPMIFPLPMRGDLL